MEQGENKSALVKVVLCPRCLKKLMWKRRKAKETASEQNSGESSNNITEPESIVDPLHERMKAEQVDMVLGSAPAHPQENRSLEREERRHHRRNSRSRSPRHTYSVSNKTSIPSRRRHGD